MRSSKKYFFEVDKDATKAEIERLRTCRLDEIQSFLEAKPINHIAQEILSVVDLKDAKDYRDMWLEDFFYEDNPLEHANHLGNVYSNDIKQIRKKLHKGTFLHMKTIWEYYGYKIARLDNELTEDSELEKTQRELNSDYPKRRHFK